MSKKKNMNLYVWFGLSDEFYCAYELYKRNHIAHQDLIECGFNHDIYKAYRSQEMFSVYKGMYLRELLDSKMIIPIGACEAEDEADALVFLSGVEGGLWRVSDTRSGRMVTERDIVVQLGVVKVKIATNGGFQINEFEDGVVSDLKLLAVSYINSKEL